MIHTLGMMMIDKLSYIMKYDIISILKYLQLIVTCLWGNVTINQIILCIRELRLVKSLPFFLM